MNKKLFHKKTLFQIEKLVICYGLIALVIPRTEFFNFFLIYTTLFIGYYSLIKSKLTLKSIFIIGVIGRCCFLFSTPVLSDDFYRFLWDGRLFFQGINPFLHPPQFYIDHPSNLVGIEELYPFLNSKNYFAIYPPINQFIFGLSALLVPIGIFKAQLVIKLILFAGELIFFRFGVKLLKLFNKKPTLIALYFLNPLVIIEVTGNLHFEGLMATFLLISFYYLKSNRWALSAVYMAFAVCTKLIPLLYLPLLFPLIGFSKSMKYLTIVVIISIALFLPFINNELLQNIFSSIDLYYQNFQFNSYFYKILIDFLGDSSKDWVAFALALIPSVLVIRFVFLKSDFKSFLRRSFLVHFIFYLCSAVIHPWYLVTLLAFTVFVEYKFIIVWSFLVGLSYYTYQDFPYQESSFLIAFQYLVVIIWSIFEYYKYKNKRLLN